MDPERQPLLLPPSSDRRYRNRPLTYDEVKESRRELPWQRMRIVLLVLFWVIITMFFSIVVCMLITASSCAKELGPGPSVPPAHLTFAPLISRARALNNAYSV